MPFEKLNFLDILAFIFSQLWVQFYYVNLVQLFVPGEEEQNMKAHKKTNTKLAKPPSPQVQIQLERVKDKEENLTNNKRCSTSLFSKEKSVEHWQKQLG